MRPRNSRRSRSIASAKARSAFRSPRRDSTLPQTMRWKDGIVGRLTSGVAGLLKKAKVKIVEGWATFRDGKTVEVETEIGASGDPRRTRGDRHRLDAGRTALPAVRRPGDLVDRGAVAAGGAEPSRRGRCRLYRAGTRHRLRQDGRRGDRGRGAAAHPAAIRRGADAAGRQAPARARHHGADRCQGEGACADQATRFSSSDRTARS